MSPVARRGPCAVLLALLALLAARAGAESGGDAEACVEQDLADRAPVLLLQHATALQATPSPADGAGAPQAAADGAPTASTGAAPENRSRVAVPSRPAKSLAGMAANARARADRGLEGARAWLGQRRHPWRGNRSAGSGGRRGRGALAAMQAKTGAQVASTDLASIFWGILVGLGVAFFLLLIHNNFNWTKTTEEATGLLHEGKHFAEEKYAERQRQIQEDHRKNKACC